MNVCMNGDAMDPYAAALVQTQQMLADLNGERERNAQLAAELNRERDRCVMVVDDRDRRWHENIMLRRLLTELATQMANIGLLTETARNIVKLVHEIDDAPVPSTEALMTLESEFAKGNEVG